MKVRWKEFVIALVMAVLQHQPATIVEMGWRIHHDVADIVQPIASG